MSLWGKSGAASSQWHTLVNGRPLPRTWHGYTDTVAFEKSINPSAQLQVIETYQDHAPRHRMLQMEAAELNIPKESYLYEPIQFKPLVTKATLAGTMKGVVQMDMDLSKLPLQYQVPDIFKNPFLLSMDLSMENLETYQTITDKARMDQILTDNGWANHLRPDLGPSGGGPGPFHNNDPRGDPRDNYPDEGKGVNARPISSSMSTNFDTSRMERQLDSMDDHLRQIAQNWGEGILIRREEEAKSARTAIETTANPQDSIRMLEQSQQQFFDGVQRMIETLQNMRIPIGLDTSELDAAVERLRRQPIQIPFELDAKDRELTVNARVNYTGQTDLYTTAHAKVQYEPPEPLLISAKLDEDDIRNMREQIQRGAGSLDVTVRAIPNREDIAEGLQDIRIPVRMELNPEDRLDVEQKMRDILVDVGKQVQQLFEAEEERQRKIRRVPEEEVQQSSSYQNPPPPPPPGSGAIVYEMKVDAPANFDSTTWALEMSRLRWNERFLRLQHENDMFIPRTPITAFDIVSSNDRFNAAVEPKLHRLTNVLARLGIEPPKGPNRIVFDHDRRGGWSLSAGNVAYYRDVVGAALGVDPSHFMVQHTMDTIHQSLNAIPGTPFQGSIHALTGNAFIADPFYRAFHYMISIAMQDSPNAETLTPEHVQEYCKIWSGVGYAQHQIDHQFRHRVRLTEEQDFLAQTIKTILASQHSAVQEQVSRIIVAADEKHSIQERNLLAQLKDLTRAYENARPNLANLENTMERMHQLLQGIPASATIAVKKELENFVRTTANFSEQFEKPNSLPSQLSRTGWIANFVEAIHMEIANRGIAEHMDYRNLMNSVAIHMGEFFEFKVQVDPRNDEQVQRYRFQERAIKEEIQSVASGLALVHKDYGNKFASAMLRTLSEDWLSPAHENKEQEHYFQQSQRQLAEYEKQQRQTSDEKRDMRIVTDKRLPEGWVKDNRSHGDTLGLSVQFDFNHGIDEDYWNQAFADNPGYEWLHQALSFLYQHQDALAVYGMGNNISAESNYPNPKDAKTLISRYLESADLLGTSEAFQEGVGASQIFAWLPSALTDPRVDYPFMLEEWQKFSLQFQSSFKNALTGHLYVLWGITPTLNLTSFLKGPAYTNVDETVIRESLTKNPYMLNRILKEFSTGANLNPAVVYGSPQLRDLIDKYQNLIKADPRHLYLGDFEVMAALACPLFGNQGLTERDHIANLKGVINFHGKVAGQASYMEGRGQKPVLGPFSDIYQEISDDVYGPLARY